MAAFSIKQLLQDCVDRGGSDIHLVVGHPPVMRAHARMHKLGSHVMTADDTLAVMESITLERHQREFQQVGGTDFKLVVGQVRVRVSAFRQRGNVSIVMRLIADDPDRPWFNGQPRF